MDELLTKNKKNDADRKNRCRNTLNCIKIQTLIMYTGFLNKRMISKIARFCNKLMVAPQVDNIIEIILNYILYLFTCYITSAYFD